MGRSWIRSENFYTANLKGAKQEIRYILKGDKEGVFEPHFTYQGFRYVKIENIREKSKKKILKELYCIRI